MFMEIGLEHRVDDRAERERRRANPATVAALAAVLLAFTGVIASVAGFGPATAPPYTRWSRHRSRWR
jgi:hypothetical protein